MTDTEILLDESDLLVLEDFEADEVEDDALLEVEDTEPAASVALPASPPAWQVVGLSRALLPLRRLLGRQSVKRTFDPGLFAQNCLKLMEGISTEGAPEALAQAIGELRDALEAVGAAPQDDDLWAVAWSQVARLDGMLRPADDVVLLAGGNRLLMASANPASSSHRASHLPSTRQAALRGGRVGLKHTLHQPFDDRPFHGRPGKMGVQGWDASLQGTPLPPTLTERLGEAGILTVSDLLLRVPHVLASSSDIVGAGHASPEGSHGLGGRVRRRWSVCHPGQKTTSHVQLEGAARVHVALRERFEPGFMKAWATGSKVTLIAICDAEGQWHDGILAARAHGDALALRYAEDAVLDAAIREALVRLLDWVDDLRDPIPEPVRQRWGLRPLVDVARQLAILGDRDTASMRRLQFETLWRLQLARIYHDFHDTAERSGRRTLAHRAIVGLEADGHIATMSRRVAAALEPIKRELLDLSVTTHVMYGDDRDTMFGTVIRSILLLAENKSQVLLTAPNPLFAQVLHDRLEPLLRGAGLGVALWGPEFSRAAADGLRRGEISVLVAPASVFDLQVEFRKLDLLVLWEHGDPGDRFARASAWRRPRPDILAVVTSPLRPEVLWRTCPVAEFSAQMWTGKPSTRSRRWPAAARQDAYSALVQDTADGKLAMIVFPMRVDGSELIPADELEGYANLMSTQLFGGKRIVALHGMLNTAQRQRVLADIREGHVDGLVTTLPIEWLGSMDRPAVVLIESSNRVDMERLLALRACAGAEGALYMVTDDTLNAADEAALDLLVHGATDVEVIARDSRNATPAAQGVVPADITTYNAKTVLAGRNLALEVLRHEPSLASDNAAYMVRLASMTWQQFVPGEPCPLPTTRPDGAVHANRKKKRRRRRK